MLTVQTMQSSIGKTVQLRFESLRVSAEVIDAKSSYGKVRLLVKPIAGSGQQWIEESRIVPEG